jgi:hypothetical protein
MRECCERGFGRRWFVERPLPALIIKGDEGLLECITPCLISCTLVETISAMSSMATLARTAVTNRSKNLSSWALVMSRIEKYSSLYTSSSETVRFIAILRLISAASSKVHSDPARLHALQGEGCPLHY